MSAHAEAGTIGPNAVIQLAVALRSAGLDRLCGQVFASAGLVAWLSDPPSGMIRQELVARLHQAMRGAGPAGQTHAVMSDAGRLTADYLLANRIPRMAQVLLRRLPASLAARLLVRAIRAHTWTFAGTGRFSAHVGSPTVFEITGNPLCANERAPAPVCVWHAAVFQRLFQALVSPRTQVVERACGALGDPCCRFVIDWRRWPDQVLPA